MIEVKLVVYVLRYLYARYEVERWNAFIDMFCQMRVFCDVGFTWFGLLVLGLLLIVGIVLGIYIIYLVMDAMYKLLDGVN